MSPHLYLNFMVNLVLNLLYYNKNADQFDDPKPTNCRLRTQSAPATMKLMRQKSAKVYKQSPGGRRVFSAVPQTFNSELPLVTRELAIGP